MLTAADLRTLADMTGPERAFLTVYLDAGDDASALDARLGQIRRLLADQPGETEHFEQNLAVVRRLLSESTAPDGGSLALYAGWAVDLARAVPLPVAVGTRVRVGDTPYVRPVAELLDEHETFAVAVVDNTVARIFLVTAEDADAEARIRGDVKNRVKKGGWSQKRYARRREKQIEGYATDVAEALVGLDAERPYARLVVLGADEAVQAVTAALRTDLADKLVGTDTVSADASDAELMDAAADLAETAERDEEEALWIQIREQSLGSDMAAFGATRVVKALALAQVDTVLVDRELKLRGTRCRECEHIVHGTPETCQRCGSGDVYGVDLVETMTEMAVRSGASVDFADPFPALTDAGGVAALLRYSLADDDAEQEERARREQAEREQAEREQREAEARASESAVAQEAEPAVVQIGVPTEEPVAEPAAEKTVELLAVPAVETVAEPAASVGAPRRNTREERPPSHRASVPSADQDPGAYRIEWNALSLALVALGLFLAVLGFRELPREIATELLAGAGLISLGTMRLLPMQRKLARTALGVVGVVLITAAVLLFILNLGR